MDDTDKQVSETVLTIMSHLRSVLSKCREQDENIFHKDNNLHQKCSTTLQKTERPRTGSEPRPRTRSPLKTPVSEKERLGKLIADATAENFELRDSNVQLRRLSKLQDCRARELKYRISLQAQRIVKERAARKSILELENVLKGKMEEIRKLEREIQEVKRQVPDDTSKAFRLSKYPTTTPRMAEGKSMSEGTFKRAKTPTRKLSDDHTVDGKPFSSPKIPLRRLSDDNSMAGEPFGSPKTPDRRLSDDNSIAEEAFGSPKTPSRKLFGGNSMAGKSFRSPKTPTSRLQMFDNKPTSKTPFKVTKSPTGKSQISDNTSATFRRQRSPSRQLFGNRSSSETTLKPPKPTTKRLRFADNKSTSETSLKLPKTPTQSGKSGTFGKKLSKGKKESSISFVLSKLNGILAELNSCRMADIGSYGPCRKILEEIQGRVLYLLGRLGAPEERPSPTKLQQSSDNPNCARDKGDGRTVKVEIFECMDKAVQVSLGEWCYYTKAQ